MKRAVLISALMVLFGCAKPNYVSNDSYTQSGAGGGASGQTVECEFHFKKLNYCAKMQWEKMPSRGVFGSFIVTFSHHGQTDAYGKPVAVDPTQDLEIDLSMPSMSHPPEPVDVQKTAAATFRAYNVYFSMSGQWRVNMRLKQGGQVVDQAYKDL